jgi:hypothetical protein
VSLPHTDNFVEILAKSVGILYVHPADHILALFSPAGRYTSVRSSDRISSVNRRVHSEIGTPSLKVSATVSSSRRLVLAALLVPALPDTKICLPVPWGLQLFDESVFCPQAAYVMYASRTKISETRMRSTVGHSSASAIRTDIAAATLAPARAHASVVTATVTGTVSVVPARTEGAVAG